MGGFSILADCAIAALRPGEETTALRLATDEVRATPNVRLAACLPVFISKQICHFLYFSSISYKFYPYIYLKTINILLVSLEQRKRNKYGS